MSTSKKTTPTTIHDDAISILREFSKPEEPFDAGMVKDLLIDVLIDHCANERNSILTRQDHFTIYKLRTIIPRIEQWLKMQAEKGRMIDVLYMHGLSLTSIDEAFSAVYNKIERGKFDPAHKETLRKLWCIISDKPEFINK